MKLTRKQLRKLILESLDIHTVTEDLGSMDPHEAYGIGYQKGQLKKTIIYCDMDGVVADFETGATSLINKHLEQAAIPGWSSASSTMRSSVRKIHRELGPDFRVPQGTDLRSHPAIKRMSYAVIGQDPGGFFLSLPPLPDGTQMLWPFLNSLNMQVNMLSAPITSKTGMTAEQGKRLWVAEHLNPQPADVIIRSAEEKQSFAIQQDGTPNIIIDDKHSTIEQWNSVGGIGILHTPGDSERTIHILKSIINEVN